MTQTFVPCISKPKAIEKFEEPTIQGGKLIADVGFSLVFHLFFIFKSYYVGEITIWKT